MAPAPHLRELIQTVTADTGSEDALEQLAVAARTTAELGQVGDRLLGHFVERARAEGRSWLEISETLGVTKQAVHKRWAGGPGAPDLSRWTARARSILEAAETAGRSLKHNYIGTEHVLLGLLAEPNSIAGRVLDSAGVTEGKVRELIVEHIGEGRNTGSDVALPYTPRAAKVFGRSLEVALAMGHNYIGTEHILLGLYGDGAGMANDWLVELGLTRELAEAKVVELLVEYQNKKR